MDLTRDQVEEIRRVYVIRYTLNKEVLNDLAKELAAKFNCSQSTILSRFNDVTVLDMMEVLERMK